MPMLALGPHIFEVAPLNFREIERETLVKWPAIARFGSRPARQFTGYGDDSLTISGLLFPHELGGRAELEAVRATQAVARPVILMGWAAATVARVFGRVVILSIRDRQDIIDRQGQGRRISYDIEVAPVGDTRRGGLF